MLAHLAYCKSCKAVMVIKLRSHSASTFTPKTENRSWSNHFVLHHRRWASKPKVHVKLSMVCSILQASRLLFYLGSCQGYWIDIVMNSLKQLGVPYAACYVLHWMKGMMVYGDSQMTNIVRDQATTMLKTYNTAIPLDEPYSSEEDLSWMY